MNLINDILLKTGALSQISGQGQAKIQWFKGIRFIDMLVSFILPLLFLLAIAFVLKARYNRKKLRDQVTLNKFYPHDDIYEQL